MVERASKGRGALVLDLSGITIISSMGLRALMIAAKELRSHGPRIAVDALQPVVAEIFDIARFGHVVEVIPSLRAALQALAAYEAAVR